MCVRACVCVSACVCVCFVLCLFVVFVDACICVCVCMCVSGFCCLNGDERRERGGVVFVFVLCDSLGFVLCALLWIVSS